MAEVKKPPVLDESFNAESAKHLKSQEALLEQVTKIAKSQDIIATNIRKNVIPEYSNGSFSNDSIKKWLEANNDGKLYGVDQTLDDVQTCTKVLANAGMANPVPSTLTQIGSDPYFGVGPFRYERVNATVADDGTYTITGMESFGHFTTDADVFVLTPIRFVSHKMTSEGKYRVIASDEANVGLHAEPRAYKLNGDLQPFMLRAAYAAALIEDIPVTRPGLAPWVRTCSYDSMKSKTKTRGAAYSALTAADMDYIYDMFLLKYANKSSQTVFAGCSNYNYYYKPKLATTLDDSGNAVVTINESNVITNANMMVALSVSEATNYLIGSSVSVGSVYGSDRNTAKCYDILDMVKIKEIQEYSDLDTAILVLDATPAAVTTDGVILSMPWYTGSCDGIVFDGSPSDPKSGKEPFVFQGMELSLGFYEWLGDMIVKNEDGTGWKAYLYKDVATDSTLEEVFEYPSYDTDNWRYPYAMIKKNDAYAPQQFGASSSTGVGDGTYLLKSATAGTRGFLAFGCLDRGANAGLRCAALSDGLSWAWWYVGSRVSVTGRNEVTVVE